MASPTSIGALSPAVRALGSPPMGRVAELAFAGVALLTFPGLVMVPRPATERLVSAAAERIGRRRVRVADVGTGSGAIAVALALRVPNAEIWATDVSTAAVALARANALRHGVSRRVHVHAGDLLEPIPGPLALVLANLPYLPAALAADPCPDAYRDDPPEAIFATGDGLGPYRTLLAGAGEKLAPDGALLFQLHRQVVAAKRSDFAELASRLERIAVERAA